MAASIKNLTINGAQHSVDVPDEMPLLWVLRDVLGMTGTKFGCGIAQCGACMIHLDGVAIRSCQLPVGAIGSRSITTIEGVGRTVAGAKVQKAWLDLEVMQCGYCQPGQIMSAAALLARICLKLALVVAAREYINGMPCWLPLPHSDGFAA